MRGAQHLLECPPGRKDASEPKAVRGYGVAGRIRPRPRTCLDLSGGCPEGDAASPVRARGGFALYLPTPRPPEEESAGPETWLRHSTEKSSRLPNRKARRNSRFGTKSSVQRQSQGTPLLRITVAVVPLTELVQRQSRPVCPLRFAAPHRPPPSAVDHLPWLTANVRHRGSPNEDPGSRQGQTTRG